MPVVVIRDSVANYDEWLPYYQSDADRRASFGCIGTMVLRGIEDANDVSVVLEFDTLENAQNCIADPALAAVVSAAGVTSEPQFTYHAFALTSER